MHVIGKTSNYFAQVKEGDYVVINNVRTEKEIKAGAKKIPFMLRFERCEVTDATDIRVVLNPEDILPVKTGEI
jgi:hypothetical protein